MLKEEKVEQSPKTASDVLLSPHQRPSHLPPNSLLPEDKAMSGQRNKDENKATLYLTFMVGGAVIGGFMYGYNLSNINIPEQTILTSTNPAGSKSVLPPSIPMSSALWGLAVSMLPFGGFIGSPLGGKCSEWLGRKWPLAISSVLFILAGVMMALAVNAPMFIIGRLLAGIPSGMSTTVIPSYISEISPDAIRGKLASFLQFSMCLGILIATIISIPLNTPTGWRWLMGLTTLPAILQLVLLPFMVESPKWLIMKGRLSEAEACYRALKGSRQDTMAQEETHISKSDKQLPLATDVAVVPTDKPPFSRISLGELEPPKLPPSPVSVSKNLTLSEFFQTPSLRRALWAGIIVNLAQQLCGINATFYYSTKMFEKAYGSHSKYITLGVGFVNMIFVTLSALTMDYLGRKWLLIMGQIGMGICLGGFTLGSIFQVDPLLVAMLLAYVSVYSISVGNATWVMTGELFPIYASSIATSITIALNWLSNFGVGMTFPILSAHLRAYSFLPFVIFIIIFGILIWIYVPETKGKSVEEITLGFQRATAKKT